WHEKSRWPEPVRRLARLWEVLTCAAPPTVVPEKGEQGLWNIPGSMIYFPMHGFRRFLPLCWRVKRAVKGLDAAARQRRIFHLWFHPTNLADRPNEMFLGLRRILAHACRLRQQGELAIKPMAALLPPGASVRSPRTATSCR